MSFFSDRISVLIDKIDSMRQEFITMRVSFKNSEITYDKFVISTEKQIDKIKTENEDLRRRMTEVEGIINATLKVSMKEAIESVLKDHIKENGDLSSLNTNNLLKSMDSKSDET